MDFPLGLLDFGHMVQDPVAEHHIEGVVGEGKVKNTALP